jgi:hypothetical protein
MTLHVPQSVTREELQHYRPVPWKQFVLGILQYITWIAVINNNTNININLNASSKTQNS